MFAGMGLRTQWYDENISIAALWGPCTRPNEKYFVDLYTEENWSFMLDNGIWVFAGPNWDRDKAIIEASGPQALVDGIPTAEGLPNNPLQAVAAYGQTAFSRRFQMYTDDWFSYIAANGTYPKTDEIDYGRAQNMQVAMYIGLFDDTCPLTYTMDSIAEMGPRVVAHTVVAPWEGHVPWAFSAEPWLVKDMEATLLLNQDEATEFLQ